MKTYLIALSIFLAHSTVHAQQPTCQQYEAQIIADVVQTTEFLKDGSRTCAFKIETGAHYRENGLCPLDRVDAEKLNIEDPNCAVKVGDIVSGVLVYERKSDRSYIDLN